MKHSQDELFRATRMKTNCEGLMLGFFIGFFGGGGGFDFIGFCYKNEVMLKRWIRRQT